MSKQTWRQKSDKKTRMQKQSKPSRQKTLKTKRGKLKMNKIQKINVKELKNIEKTISKENYKILLKVIEIMQMEEKVVKYIKGENKD